VYGSFAFNLRFPTHKTHLN